MDKLISFSADLDEWVYRYELSWKEGKKPDIKDYLPPENHPIYLSILKEIIRVDMEFVWSSSDRCFVHDYLELFPCLNSDKRFVLELAFEEFRLRVQAGESPKPSEYEKEFGITTKSWLIAEKTPDHADNPFKGMSQESFYEKNLLPPTRKIVDCDDSKRTPGVATTSEKSNFMENSPEVVVTPKIGEEAFGFVLLEELGRGSFATVFLAKQLELAHRIVALKVAPRKFFNESQTLAQLQHTNIMPIFSVHAEKGMVALCMPYLGATTLSDVICTVNKERNSQISAKDLLQSVLDTRKHSYTAIDASSPNVASTMETQQQPRISSSKKDNANLESLEGLSINHWILSIFSGLSAGLAHAHQRGVYHRDLKPANILLTDDGQPMLLDFNLALSEKELSMGESKIGGTLPYMAPEQLEGLMTHKSVIDARSDIYALGLILYEFLTGTSPFPSRLHAIQTVIPSLLADRNRIPKSPRQLDRKISPAVSAIVMHCLHSEPRKRYQKADDLKEDIDRHLNHLPLRHAPNNSVIEQVYKWKKRHPHLTSAGSMTIFATVIIISLIALIVYRQRTTDRLVAKQTLMELDEAMPSIAFRLHAPSVPQSQLNEGLSLANSFLSHYDVVKNRSWLNGDSINSFSQYERASLRRNIAELAWLVARTNYWHSKLHNSNRERKLKDAYILNLRAIECFCRDKIPAPVAHLHASILEEMDRHSESRNWKVIASNQPVTSPVDQYFALSELLGSEQWAHALPMLRKISIKNDPTNSAAWMILGNCHAELGNLNQADACYDLAQSLSPASPWVWFNRGLVSMQKKDWQRAKSQFTRATSLRPNFVEAFMNRGLVENSMGNYKLALEDFDRVIKLNSPYTRIYFMRAAVKHKLNDLGGARADQEFGLKQTPTDPESWVARGVAWLRLRRNPEKALDDFERALRQRPSFKSALQNKAHVLSEYVEKTKDAIKALDLLLENHPKHVPAIAGRGVLYARIRQRELALKDAENALKYDSAPEVLYQVAGIYAQTARMAPDDRRISLGLLRKAFIQQPYWIGVVSRDPDLEPIRNDLEFKKLLAEMSKKN